MIIHNPEITGSLIFPRTDGTKVAIQISSQGGIEAVEQDATGSVTGIPHSNFSGSFTGSFVGDGSQITGVAASSLNIDSFTAGTIAGDDEILFSDTDDSGNEKRGTFQGALDSVGVVSGSGQIVLESADKTGFTGVNTIITLGSVTTGDVIAILPSGTVSGSSQITYESISSIPSGIVSGSSQITYESISSIPSGIVSGSSQIDVEQTTNFSTFSSSIASTFDGLSSNYVDLIGIPSGIVSSSAQIDTLGFLQVNGDSVVSGSAQIDITSTTGTLDISSRTNLAVSDTSTVDMVLTGDTLSANVIGGIVSGSSQVVLQSADKTGFTGASSITTLGTVTSGNVTAILPSGTVSGSSQVIGILSSLNSYTSSTDLRIDSLESFSSSIETAISVDGTNVTIVGNLEVQGTTTTIDSDTLAIGSSVISLNGSAAVLAGLIVNDVTSPSTTSGSLLWNGTNDYWIAGPSGSESKILLANGDSVVSGSSQVDHDATTNFVANEHINHANVSITAGNGLTGGGTIAATRTLAVGGTADRISVSADAVDIASTYVGQSTIITLGTITTGTWNGSVIASAYLDSDTAHLSGTQTFTGAKTFSNSTASTTKTTGAVIVTGGVGIGGALNVGGDVVAYASSDRRLKDNIQNIENPIEKVQKLNGVTWDWNSNADELQQSLPNVGVIAQEVEEVFPQLVHDRDNGYKGVDYAKLTGLLIEAIKEQQKQIDELKSRLG